MARLHPARRIQASHRAPRERIRLRSRRSSFHPGPPVLRRLFEWDAVAAVSLLLDVREILGLGMGSVSRRQREVQRPIRSEEQTSELQSLTKLVCRLVVGNKKMTVYAALVWGCHA